MLRVLACSVLLGAAAFAQAQHSPQHGGHSAGKRPQSELGSSAAFDGRGNLWAVSKEGAHAVVRRSDDTGRTWSAPRRVNAVPEAIEANGDSRPKLALGNRGELYVTWTKALGKFHTGDIRFARSLDEGKTFSAPITVNTDRQQITHRFDAIAVTGTGRIFLAWIDTRDQVALAKGTGGEYTGAAVYFAVSDDRGATFRGDFKLADHSCECCRIALVPMPDQTVAAMWRHVFAPNVRDHALARMEESGRHSEPVRATFDDWRIDACPHHGPALAADSAGRLHAVWFTEGPNAAGVFYGRVGNAGVEARRRIGGETAEHADLASSGEALAIAWKEFDGERSRLRAMVSDNGGENWRSHELGATAGASDQPRVLQRQGRFYVFWNTSLEPLSVFPIP
jgi:hypothetical protein